MPLPIGDSNHRTQPAVRSYEECWAKTTPNGNPGISVEQHCRATAVVAQLLTQLHLPEIAIRLKARNGIALAALHDVGKISPGFQGQCAPWRAAHGLPLADFAGAERDHGKIGQRAVQEELASRQLSTIWAAVVGAHHGKLKGERIPELCDGDAHWQAERRRFIAAMIEDFGPLPDTAVHGHSAALWFNAGLVAVADWLASDERGFPPGLQLDSREIGERAKTHLEAVGFLPPGAPIEKPCFRTLFPGLKDGPNPLQLAMTGTAREPGIYVVEAAMGAGKTEAALLAAANLMAEERATGLYFALPTQTTSNRIHERVSEFIERLAPCGRARLIHGNSWLLDRNAPVTGEQWTDDEKNERAHDGRDWFASSRRALLAPFGVGTVDQALLGVVAAKHFFVRQFGLAGKVVILDEVHSYDLYTGTLIDKLVEKLRELGSTVIILSATLTAERRRLLLGCESSPESPQSKPYPMISISADGRHSEVSLPPDPPRTVHATFSALADLTPFALGRAAEGQCVLWIRNTVHDAQETYCALKSGNRADGPDIALLHARFPLFRREELENDWLNRLGRDRARRPVRGCVLVATQVAEQSVDIDADLLLTDLAPTDMLLQRIGRLWRHPGARPAGCDRPEVRIALPDMDLNALRAAPTRGILKVLGRGGKVYAPYVLLRTLDQWRTKTSIELPGEIRALLERTYEERRDEPEAWNELRETMEKERDRLRRAALTNANVWELALDDREGVQTRWGGCPTVGVLIVKTVGAWDARRGANIILLDGSAVRPRAGAFDFSCAKAIHRNLVKVPRWSVAKLLPDAPAWLKSYTREPAVALLLKEGRLRTIPGDPDSGLEYRDDMGVRIPAWTPVKDSTTMGKEDLDESYDW